MGCFAQNLGRGFAFEAKLVAVMVVIEVVFLVDGTNCGLKRIQHMLYP